MVKKNNWDIYNSSHKNEVPLFDWCYYDLIEEDLMKRMSSEITKEINKEIVHAISTAQYIPIVGISNIKSKGKNK